MVWVHAFLGLVIVGLIGGRTAPINDSFGNRQPLGEPPVSLTFNNSGASSESTEPSPAVGFPVHSVWWTWTAPKDGLIRVLNDEMWPAVVVFYTGSQLASLAPVAPEVSMPAPNPGSQGSMWVRVTSNTTYQISIDYQDIRILNLGFSFYPTPEHDRFENAIELGTLPVSFTNQHIAATMEAGEPAPIGASTGATVWYRWTAPSNGILSVESPTYWSSFAVYAGETLTNLTRISAPFELIVRSTTARVEEGKTYYLSSARWNPFSYLFLDHDPLVWSAAFNPAPVNDYFERRILLSDASGQLTVEAALAIDQAVWYEWIAPANGTLLPGIGQPYVGTNTAQLVPLPDSSSGIAVTQGMSIKLSVHAPTPKQFAWQFYPHPSNDRFAGAQVISGGSATLTGHNYGAGREAGEPNHGPDFGGRTIWYRWTAPTNGWVSWYVTTPAATPSTLVYEGTALSRLKRVTNQSQIISPEALFLLYEFQAVAGRTYCFVVDNQRMRADGGPGYYVNPPGTFDMEFTFTTVRLNAELVHVAGDPLLKASFIASNPAAVLDISAAQYGFIYLDRFCPTLAVPGNRPNGALLWTNPPPGRYLIYGAVSNNSGGTAVLSPVNLRVPPANDSQADAEWIEGFEFTRTSPIAGSAREPREPSHGDGKGLGSIWWKWTAPADGSVDVGLTLYGHRFGQEPSDRNGITPSLAVYVVKNGKLVRIAGARRAKYTVGCRLQVRQGMEYLIAGQYPEGYYLSDCGGNAELRVRLAAAKVAASVAGQTFQHRLPIPLEIESNFPIDEIERVEFVETQDLGRPPRLLVGTNVSPFRAIWDGASKGPHEVAAKVYRKDGQAFTTDFVKLFVRTANDNFADAVVLSSMTPVVLDDVSYASREPGEPRETGPPYGDSVWYRWTAPTSGKWMLRLVGFGEAVYFYTGSSVSSLRSVALQRNQGGTLYWFNASSGTTYHIAVKRNHIWPAPYELSLLPAEAPVNDSFANPTALSLGATQAVGTLRFATSQPDEPGGNNASAWYTWTAPSNGVLAIKRYAPLAATRIYTGSTLATLEELTDLADPGVQYLAVRWHCYRVEANQTYRLQVAQQLGYGDYLDPYWDLNANQFNVELLFEATPENDAFDHSVDLPAGSSVVEGRGLGAGSEPLDLMGGSPTAVTRWWNWQAPANGTLSVSFNSIYVQAFHGNSLDGLTSIPSSVYGFTVSVTAGEQLRLCAYHYHQWVDPFSIQLEFQPAAPAQGF